MHVSAVGDEDARPLSVLVHWPGCVEPKLHHPLHPGLVGLRTFPCFNGGTFTNAAKRELQDALLHLTQHERSRKSDRILQLCARFLVWSCIERRWELPVKVRKEEQAPCGCFAGQQEKRVAACSEPLESACVAVCYEALDDAALELRRQRGQHGECTETADAFDRGDRGQI